MANDIHKLREYEALKAALEMAAKDTSSALDRVAKELSRQQLKRQELRDRNSAPAQPAVASS